MGRYLRLPPLLYREESGRLLAKDFMGPDSSAGGARLADNPVNAA